MKTYYCDRCGRKLKPERWVFSSHTRKRYCWPGTGCLRTTKGSPKRAPRRAYMKGGALREGALPMQAAHGSSYTLLGSTSVVSARSSSMTGGVGTPR